MKTVFIDTNVLLEYIRDSPLGQAAWALGEIEAPSTEAFIPGVCAGELLAIRERSDRGPEQRAIQGGPPTRPTSPAGPRRRLTGHLVNDLGHPMVPGLRFGPRSVNGLGEPGNAAAR